MADMALGVAALEFVPAPLERVGEGDDPDEPDTDEYHRVGGVKPASPPHEMGIPVPGAATAAAADVVAVVIVEAAEAG